MINTFLEPVKLVLCSCVLLKIGMVNILMCYSRSEREFSKVNSSPCDHKIKYLSAAAATLRCPWALWVSIERFSDAMVMRVLRDWWERLGV